MSITMDWGDYDESFLVMRFIGNWSAEDFYEIMDRYYQTIGSKSQPIELLVDMRNSVSAPRNLLTIIRAVIQRPHQGKTKRVVIINQSSFWTRMVKMIDQTYGNMVSVPIIVAPTVDDAYQQLDFFQAEL